MKKRINQSVAAPFTPFLQDGSLNLSVIEKYARFLKSNNIYGAFICGSSGEGALMTVEERMTVAEEWMRVAGSDMKVIVHTGGANVSEQKQLAAHARRIGAYAVATMAPTFLAPKRMEELVAYCKTIADEAPDLPFYFYHIPALNNYHCSIIELLKAVDKVIPNFAGIKYTVDNLYEFDQCKYIADGKFEMLHGLDETFLSALTYGYQNGVGGTYNQCFSLYDNMKTEFAKGNLEKCRELQHKSHLFINILAKYRGNIVCGKRIMKFIGLDCGPNRLPLQNISEKEEKEIYDELQKIDFFSFCNKFKD